MKKKKSKKTDKPLLKPTVNDNVPSRLTIHDSRVHIACLVFLVLIIYCNTLKSQFQWDEGDFIVNNPLIKDLHYFASPSDAKGFELYNGLITRYIGYLTFALNYRIHGLSVTGYHIVNIAIHVASSILVYLFVMLTFRTPFFTIHDSRFTIHDSRSLIAFFSAALFAAHPIQTEAVTYIFQRLASLAAFFYLLSLTAYIKSRLTAVNSESKTKKHSFTIFAWFLLSLFFAVCAMKTKENAFTLPFVITLYEFCFFRDSIKKRALYLAPILLTLAIIPLSLMNLTGTQHLDPGSYGAREFQRNEYLFTQFRVIVTYLRLLFFPVNQNIDYDYPVFKSFLDLPVLLSFVFLSALFGLGVYLVLSAKGKEQRVENAMPYALCPMRLMGFGILWFFITLSVESSIIPIPMLIDEYRVYLPSVGLIISVVTGAFWVFSRFTNSRCFGSTFHDSRPLIAMLVLALGVLAIAAYQRNEVWGDNIRLWEDAVSKSPEKAMTHDRLGAAYQSRDLPDKALEQFLIAVKLNPDSSEAHYNLGVNFQDHKMPDKAMEQYLIAIKISPDHADPHYNLGNIYLDRNMPDEAIEQYLIAIKLKPDYVGAHNNLGITYQSRSMPDKALHEMQTVIHLRPNEAYPYFNLGVLYYKMGQMENARAELMTGLKIKPDDQQAQELLHKISG